MQEKTRPSYRLKGHLSDVQMDFELSLDRSDNRIIKNQPKHTVEFLIKILTQQLNAIKREELKWPT